MLASRFTTRETVLIDTPAAAATSTMVARGAAALALLSFSPRFMAPRHAGALTDFSQGLVCQ